MFLKELVILVFVLNFYRGILRSGKPTSTCVLLKCDRLVSWYLSLSTLSLFLSIQSLFLSVLSFCLSTLGLFLSVLSHFLSVLSFCLSTLGLSLSIQSLFLSVLSHFLSVLRFCLSTLGLSLSIRSLFLSTRHLCFLEKLSLSRLVLYGCPRGVLCRRSLSRCSLCGISPFTTPLLSRCLSIAGFIFRR